VVIVFEDQMAHVENAGWVGTVSSLLTTDEADWLHSLLHHHQRCMLMRADEAQQRAWKNCFAVLQTQLTDLVQHLPGASAWTLVFEFELPRERGRRPDVVVLTDSAIRVLEFKDASRPLHAHIDQVAAYARDLGNYHQASHNRTIEPMLVLTRAGELDTEMDEVRVVGPNHLASALMLGEHESTAEPIDPAAWLGADYSPLPSLVTAARTIFNHEPLPQIRRASSAGIPETIASLTRISEEAERHGGLHLALVTGVPGAGKTLVGLQFVYTHQASKGSGARSAVFLSGNGPLIKVLQHALKSSVFVQDVHGFLRQYGGATSRIPEEHIWVYDEAQRAWDAERVRSKRGHDLSEPEDFLRLGERMRSWAVVVGLIGEGQEIHLGEEAGLGQWNDAIAALPGEWTVHCPPRLALLFPAAKQTATDCHLDLTESLRSHLAEDVQRWVREVLSGDLDSAAVTAERMRAQGFNTYIARDLAIAETYVRERYAEQADKRFGLLASSKAKNLPRWGIQNGFNFTRNFREGPWYNDPPDSPMSCCQLHDVATEFACQGLELDFPIVCWGDDLQWQSMQWQSPPQPRSHARDSHQLRINSYRVLLSRGRDGFVAFVPREPQMESAARALLAAGLLPL
jgi:hypothetical protein